MKLSIPFLNKKKPSDQSDDTAVPTALPNPDAPSPVMPEAKQVKKDPVKQFSQGTMSVRDIIAPSAIEVDFNFIKIGNTYFRTLFVNGYPRFVAANWLGPLINFDHSLTVSMFIYPVEGKEILDQLHRKIAEMEAELQSDIQRGKIVNPDTQAKLEDSRALQEVLVKGIERFFQFGLYVSIPAQTLEELNQVTSQVVSTLGSLLIVAKPTSLEMEKGFKSTLPYAYDAFMITRNMDTTSLATTFPFVSSELTSNEGIMYGLNEHNGSLIVFDRFSLENANSVVFAKSGAGKSFMVKLEALRSLMFGSEIIIIDPENEYQNVCGVVGGEYINFGIASQARINPFDLSSVSEPGENALSMKVLSLHSLFKVIMGELSPGEEATLDRALILTYKMKGITPEPESQNSDPPLLEDLYKALLGMEDPESKSLADRLEKFVKGSFRGIFDQPSNVDLKNPFTVFSIRDMEDALRPIAMFIILDYIWNIIRKDLKRRILVVDEAWYMMRYGDSASFMYAIAKRARKYYLGLTTITQDVEDFLSTDYGKAIVTNSSIQILLKQSTAAIERLTQVFYLSEGEQHLLLSADVGQGLFFAGPSHVAVRVIASPEEYSLVTTKPSDAQTTPKLVSSQPTPAPQSTEVNSQTPTAEQLSSETQPSSPQPAQPAPLTPPTNDKSGGSGGDNTSSGGGTPPTTPPSSGTPPVNTPPVPSAAPVSVPANISPPQGLSTSAPAATHISPMGGSMPQLNSLKKKSDSQSINSQKGIHQLSNLELKKINQKIHDPVAARDPQFKQILQKVTDQISPGGSLPRQVKQDIKKIAEDEISSRYHSGAWTEDTLPEHILPSKDVVRNWSDKQLQTAINAAENQRFMASGRNISQAGMKQALLQYYKDKRVSKGQWSLKDSDAR